jgi:hypothetical protein
MVESRKPSNNQSKFIVLWEKMDKTAYNDILEADLNNNLQEQDDRCPKEDHSKQNYTT